MALYSQRICVLITCDKTFLFLWKTGQDAEKAAQKSCKTGQVPHKQQQKLIVTLKNPEPLFLKEKLR